MQEAGAPVVYEAHIGGASGEDGRVGTFVYFTESVLPRIKKLGYNTLLVRTQADATLLPAADTDSFRLSWRC